MEAIDLISALGVITYSLGVVAGCVLGSILWRQMRDL